ncbi:hypothetical protein AGMMS50256_30660 [Betaproteobacteria bacterium]|nr:hypothetical protein AGMMS50256_30660 [Betaproteobacteria bacterium]
MDNSKFSPEFLKKMEEEKRKADKTIKEFRKQFFDSINFFVRATDRGAITLDALLQILAGESFQDHKRYPQTVPLSTADIEYYEGYRTLLGNVKRAILKGELTIRQLTTLAPVNNEPGIQSWCNEDDTLKSVDNMRPHGRIVVKNEDARAWLISLGISAPEWLTDSKQATAGITSPVPNSERTATIQKTEATSWKVKAREIADELFDCDTQNGCRDSLKNYSGRVMEEMQKRNIHGPNGLIDNQNTIKREALQGVQWWAKKQK